MIIYDFFSGTGSATKAFEDAGHTVIKVELDSYFEANERDILTLTAEGLISKYGRPDFIWASPPCTTFSVASIGKHWTIDKKPKSKEAELAIELVGHTIALIQALNPVKGFIIENPRGMLRKQSLMKQLPRQTITYCQYGDFRMKPTDLWGTINNWVSKPACKNGDKCHQSSPRGSRTGTQSIKGARLRSMIPYELGKEILNAITY
ncbi:MAG: DNA cytosine methyltransferase [Candidatus Nanopelagicaceae bacterium]